MGATNMYSEGHCEYECKQRRYDEITGGSEQSPSGTRCQMRGIEERTQRRFPCLVPRRHVKRDQCESNAPPCAREQNETCRKSYGTGHRLTGAVPAPESEGRPQQQQAEPEGQHVVIGIPKIAHNILFIRSVDEHASER